MMPKVDNNKQEETSYDWVDVTYTTKTGKQDTTSKDRKQG
jgi:hypothetical protein